MPNPLDALAVRHGTDKSSRYHRYTEAYYQVFHTLRLKRLKIVEIGVATGASLRLWADFFPHARIFGIDVDPAARSHETRRIRIFTGDQSNIRFLESFKRQVGKIDIVIDDGSHRPEDQLASLKCFFPSLRSTGVYVIEDLCCSYHRGYGSAAGLHNRRNTIEYLKAGLDVIHAEAQYGGVRGDRVTENLKAMLCFPRIAFLFKGRAQKRLPGYHGPDRRIGARS
jgi:hypothetical protein